MLDALKRDGETLVRTSPKSDRIQPYKAQYVRLCGMYVASMKEHQKAKESLRKVQSDDLVRRGMLIYGDTKSEAEIRRKASRMPFGMALLFVLTPHTLCRWRRTLQTLCARPSSRRLRTRHRRHTQRPRAAHATWKCSCAH